MIRNFLYVDSDRLRSISSQLFEGVADSILKRDTEETSETGSQKGPLGSGEILADIFRKSTTAAQTKVLEDHAYTLFEAEILKSGKVTYINQTDPLIEQYDKPFIKVTGNLSINDPLILTGILSNFNEFGADMTRVVHQEQLKANALGKLINKKDVEKLAETLGMQMDKDFSSSLMRLIEFSAKGMLEFEVSFADRVFSAPIKRDFLREREDFLVKKYSRYSESQFTIFGLVTQSGKNDGVKKPLADVANVDNLKTALRNMSGHIRTIEDAFGGLSKNEVIIDPIAVYQTL